MIHYHGNAEDMQYFVKLQGSSSTIHKFIEYIKVNMFIVEYRGYGIYQHSSNNSQLVEEDALTSYDYIKQTYKLQDSYIYIFGRSLGTGHAFYLASQRKCNGLIVMSAYKSIKMLLVIFVVNLDVQSLLYFSIIFKDLNKLNVLNYLFMVKWIHQLKFIILNNFIKIYLQKFKQNLAFLQNQE